MAEENKPLIESVSIMTNNTKLSICAYFLSKFDMQAVEFLMYRTRNEALVGISTLLGKENNYLKRRRDEFDVLTGSHRIGQRNRKPTPIVSKIHHELTSFSFLELATIVQQILMNPNIFTMPTVSDVDKRELVESLDNNDIEDFVNQKDTSAMRIKKNREVLERVFDPKIPNKLKELYGYRCQICGFGSENTYGYAIVEAHHIIPFSTSLNNDSNNIIILCPNHHRLMHKANPRFDIQNKNFVYRNGNQENLKYNFHL